MTRALLALLLLAPLAAAQEMVHVRRLSDVVAVREGELHVERVLYYFHPTVQLRQGDELEQGSGGHSEVLLAGGGLLVVHASAHLVFDRLAAEGDAVRLPLVTRLEAYAGERPLQLVLPGGTLCELLGTHVTVHAEPGRLRVRNEGSTPVVVTSDLRLEREPASADAAGRLELVRGEEVRLVLVGGATTPPGETLSLWGALPVRHGAELALQPEGDVLRLLTVDPQVATAGSFTVRGVRTVPRPGLAVHHPAHVELPSTPAPPPADEGAAPAEDSDLDWLDDQPADEPPAEADVPPESPPDEGADEPGDEPK